MMFSLVIKKRERDLGVHFSAYIVIQSFLDEECHMMIDSNSIHMPLFESHLTGEILM